MSAVRTFIDVVNKTNVFMGKLMVGVTLFAVPVITFEVVMRYVFSMPTNWGHETMILMFAIFYCAAAGYCHYYRAHVRVDVIYATRSPRTKAYMDLFTSVFFFLFVGVFTLHELEFLLELPDHAVGRKTLRDRGPRRGLLYRLGASLLPCQVHDALGRISPVPAGDRLAHPRHPHGFYREGNEMSIEWITILMFGSHACPDAHGVARGLFLRDRGNHLYRPSPGAFRGQHRPNADLRPDGQLPAGRHPALHLHGLHPRTRRAHRRDLRDGPPVAGLAQGRRRHGIGRRLHDDGGHGGRHRRKRSDHGRDCLSRDAPEKIRQAYGRRVHPGRRHPGDSDPSERHADCLRDGRQLLHRPALRRGLLCRGFSWRGSTSSTSTSGAISTRRWGPPSPKKSVFPLPEK